MSATYTPALLVQLEQLMREPQRVLLSPETTSLLGVRQFYSLVPGECLPNTTAGSGLTSMLPTSSNQRMLSSLPVGPSLVSFRCCGGEAFRNPVCNLWEHLLCDETRSRYHNDTLHAEADVRPSASTHGCALSPTPVLEQSFGLCPACNP